jgi:SOS-response transcriptional repressor LexA
MKSVKEKEAAEAEKFQQIWKNSGLSCKDFGKTLEISESYVSNIVRGARKPSREVLERLAQVYDVDLGEFLFGEGGLPNKVDSAYIDLIKQEAAAGHGLDIDDYAERSRIAVPRSIIGSHRPEHIKAVIVKGDSMIGAHIFEGDYVLFNTQDKEGENIFVLSINNTLLVKRVSFDALTETMTLISENSIYEPRVIKGADLDTVNIAGKVIACIHRMSM